MTIEALKIEHQNRVLDQKLSEINKAIEALERLRREVQALEKRGAKEQAFFAGRRSMAYELRESGGLASAKLGTEILFLLPDDFIQFYGSLFHRALRVGDSSVMHGRSGGVERAKGRTGMQLGEDDRGGQAQGSGKKYKNTPMTIGNEDMLKLKQRLDGQLVKLTREYSELIGLQASGTSNPGTTNPRTPSLKCLTESCRRFVKADWKFCPGCGGQLK